MKSFLHLAVFGAALLAENAAAHPGHNVKAEAAERTVALNSMSKRSLAHCANILKARGNEAAMIKRRHAMAEDLRQKRAIQRGKPYLQARDFDTVLATDHHSNMTGVSPSTDPSVLFTGNASCILTPEVTQGPYYVTGEYVRRNVTEDQAGVPFTLDIQIIDVNTCEPLPEVYLESWHCNSTGVYGGVIANGNGNTDDASNINATFLRGIQKSDDDGVLTFDTIFPGHYTGRANHIHILAHLNATLMENATLTGGTVGHVGQIFFDQDLITQVEASAPYNTNTQNLTVNANDGIMESESEDVDPVVEYVMLGDAVEDGIFAWIAFGMDSTASYNVSAAASLTSSGGVANNNTGGFGGGMPSGSGAPPMSTGS